MLHCLCLAPGGNTTPPVSTSNLCSAICFVFANSSPVFGEHFTGMRRPRGVLCASNYEESATATWFQGRRHRGGFRPPQLSAVSGPSAVSSHSAASPGLCLDGQQPRALSWWHQAAYKAQRNRFVLSDGVIHGSCGHSGWLHSDR